jgi:hypothetical protein
MLPLAANTNCNRSCWKAPNLFGLKNTIFQLCGVYNTVQILQTNETFRKGTKPWQVRLCFSCWW